MRALIVGFALGVGWLQWQPALPEASRQRACAAFAIALLLGVALARSIVRRVRLRSGG